jgi:NAD(P)-dependent dehydrogenase (short-subunit alcohol dehydrogenase family)
MSDNSLKPSKTAIVTVGSRGLGRGVVQALAGRGMRVLALAHDGARPESRELAGVEPVAADASDEKTAARLPQALRPDLVVLCAGASALLRPLHLHSWETVSENWAVDTKSAFVWLHNALLLPMKPDGHLVICRALRQSTARP